MGLYTLPVEWGMLLEESVCTHEEGIGQLVDRGLTRSVLGLGNLGLGNLGLGTLSGGLINLDLQVVDSLPFRKTTTTIEPPSFEHPPWIDPRVRIRVRVGCVRVRVRVRRL